MFGYTENSDVPFKIQGSPSYFAGVFKFFAQLSGSHNLNIQIYI